MADKYNGWSGVNGVCTQGWTGDMTRVYSSLDSSDLEEELVAVNRKCTLMCFDFCMFSFAECVRRGPWIHWGFSGLSVKVLL